MYQFTFLTIRVLYGTTLIALSILGLCQHKSILAQINSISGISGTLLFLGMTVSAFFLILESVGILIVKNQKCKQLKIRFKTLCVYFNRRRHWFYLPPASACLAVIPLSYKFGINEPAITQWTYLSLCLAGIGFAIIEGVISNESARRYA